jgi:hypothetical protein
MNKRNKKLEIKNFIFSLLEIQTKKEIKQNT